MQFQQSPGRIFALDSTGTLIAEITFPIAPDGTVEITHTFVHPRLRGRGVAAQMMEAAVDVIGRQGRSVRPVCAYAVDWFARHPQAQSLLHTPQ